jgi:hypothetical protein
MSNTKLIDVYDSQTTQYHRAFQVFLDHTDQKNTARRWLDRLVQGLSSRRVFNEASSLVAKIASRSLH